MVFVSNAPFYRLALSEIAHVLMSQAISILKAGSQALGYSIRRHNQAM
jgi:hypothetical protein